MYVWVIYDIRKNKARQKVAKRCKYYGLIRVQKSVFLGQSKGKWNKMLFTEISNIINQRTDRLFVLPMAQSAFESIRESGNAPPLNQIVAAHKVKII
jgi:CRISPR-associated protein Cas2